MRAVSIAAVSSLLVLAGLWGCVSPSPDQAIPANVPPGDVDPAAPQLVVLGTVRTMLSVGHVAGGLVIRNGIIEQVTSRDLALSLARPGTRIVRLREGQVVLPGIIESHAHFLSVGRTSREMDAGGTASAEEVAERLRAWVEGRSEVTWVQGRGWNQEAWPGKTFPHRKTLDEVAPRHLVALRRVDGHALWINTRALEAAGIKAETKNPPGGEIIRDSKGEATGVLIDSAMNLVTQLIPPHDDPEIVASDLLRAQAASLAEGLTTFVDAGSDETVIAAMRRLYEDGRMKIRLYVMRSATGEDFARVMHLPRLIGLYGDRLDVRAVKMYADGALGSRGAWLLEPYADRAGHTGLVRTSPALLREAARLAIANGYQLCVHAIGDRANREVLDAFAAGLGGITAARQLDHRFRVEHAQILDLQDIPRFRQLRVLPSMQTCHCASDGAWVPARIGADRTLEGAYAWRSLLDSGSLIPNGTDAPVEPLSPWRNLYTALTRLHEDQAGPPLNASQALSRYEGLLSITHWGAYGIFADRRRGILRPGYQADFVVVDRDPMTCPLAAIPGTQTLMTVIGGEVAYEAGGEGR